MIPACPDRSLVNSAIYWDAAALRAALPALAEAYAQAGVKASIVWTHDDEREAIAALEAAGYRFDGSPAAMYLELADLGGHQPGELDWDDEASTEEVGRVNDLAYGFAAGEGPGPAIGFGPPELPTRYYRALVGGRTASVLGTIDVEGDCMIVWVSTLPEDRGRGLAAGLLGAALHDASERGLRTSTLQASMLGRGVYERLGYRVAARFQLYERRQ